MEDQSSGQLTLVDQRPEAEEEQRGHAEPIASQGEPRQPADVLLAVSPVPDVVLGLGLVVVVVGLVVLGLVVLGLVVVVKKGASESEEARGQRDVEVKELEEEDVEVKKQEGRGRGGEGVGGRGRGGEEARGLEEVRGRGQGGAKRRTRRGKRRWTHVINHGMTLREAGQRVQPNLSRYTVASIIRTFRNENRIARRPDVGGRGRMFTPEQEPHIVNMRVMELEADAIGHELLFVDEAGFNLSKTRRRGRNIIGHRAIINVPGQRRW
ncbi:hypothetical protein N1851_022569 [Merluccius polli]|uniref:Transposase n=1 Tax=Merluccius polli TaxID=89951 RepID=A0AA47MHP4_MERPO|nr:hypothetical protein N1851_022569 [Merluccius polli]